MDLFAASPTQPPRAIKWPDESRCERLTFTVKKKAPAEGKDDKLGIYLDAQKNEMAQTRPSIIAGCADGYEAKRVGIQERDIVWKLNGHQITIPDSISEIYYRALPGNVEVVVLRPPPASGFFSLANVACVAIASIVCYFALDIEAGGRLNSFIVATVMSSTVYVVLNRLVAPWVEALILAHYEKQAAEAAAAARAALPPPPPVPHIELAQTPGMGVYAAAAQSGRLFSGNLPLDEPFDTGLMAAHLVVATREGFEVRHESGEVRMRATVARNTDQAAASSTSDAVWKRGRDEWVHVARAAPSAAAAYEANWHGIARAQSAKGADAEANAATARVADDVAQTETLTEEGGAMVLLSGLTKRPDLNGRLGTVVDAEVDVDVLGRRHAVRIEGRTEPLLLNSANMLPYECDLVGLSAAGLRAFRSAHADVLEEGLTVAQAVQKIVLPLTAACGKSLAQALVDVTNVVDGSGADAEGHVLAGRATVALIAPDCASLAEVLRTAESLADEGDGVVWLEAFSLNHHLALAVFNPRLEAAATKIAAKEEEEDSPPAGATSLRPPPKPWWRSVAAPKLATLPRVHLLLGEPWDKVPGLRRWPFIWIIDALVAAGATLDLAASSASAARLREEVMRNTHFNLSIFPPRVATPRWRSRLDGASTRLEVLEYGAAVAEETLDSLDGAIRHVLDEWLVEQLAMALDQLPATMRAPSGLLGLVADSLTLKKKHARAVPLYRELIAVRVRELGPQNSLTIDTTGKLAHALSKSGGHAEAETMWRIKLDGCLDLPDTHDDKIEALAGLGEALLHQGGAKRREARELMRKAVEARQRTMGKSEEEVGDITRSILAKIDAL
jgi:hypothetical protein